MLSLRSGARATRTAARAVLSQLLHATPVTATTATRHTVQSTRAVPARSFASASGVDVPLPSSMYQTDCGLYIDQLLPRSFDKILIANRGEIACRIIRTCRELGIKTVAVYSDADAQAQHVQMADEAYRIGEAAAAKSYLLGDKIIEIAKQSGAQAIHPGYGFLSENAGFCRQCEASGVEFIGPPVKAIEAMGSKSASKIIMTNAKVPVVPGYHGEDQSMERLKAEAEKVGFPIMLKAVLGGGGKGMRIVHKAEELVENIEACKREAQNSFNDSRILMERYIVRPRHIEFQIFADKHGNAVHLFERDCSVQRRHQKVLEEAPGPGMTPEMRATMGQSAVDAAKAVGYVGAGTVEFIFDSDTDEYFFMEMNTRLQVEHPVTEMIMRKDLVQWQLHVAAGHKLPVQQQQVSHAYGHAIEARVYAENPSNNFLPATGKLIHLQPPAQSKTLRHESGVVSGDEVSIFYDPMIAKLVVWGPTREQALDHMAIALQQYQIVGPPNNIPFLLSCVNHPAFRKGGVTTAFIPTHIKTLLPPESEQAPAVPTAFALLYLLCKEQSRCSSNTVTSPWAANTSFRVNGSGPRETTLLKPRYAEDGEVVQDEIKCSVTNNLDTSSANAINNNKLSFNISFQNQTIAATVNVSKIEHRDNGLRITAILDQRTYHATVVHDAAGNAIHVFVDGIPVVQYKLPVISFGSSAGAGHGGCVAPMAGKVVKVAVKAGDKVVKGQSLVIMEAMKMEHVIKASHDAVVEQVHYQTGDFVEGGKLLVALSQPAKAK